MLVLYLCFYKNFSFLAVLDTNQHEILFSKIITHHMEPSAIAEKGSRQVSVPYCLVPFSEEMWQAAEFVLS